MFGTQLICITFNHGEEQSWLTVRHRDCHGTTKSSPCRRKAPCLFSMTSLSARTSSLQHQLQETRLFLVQIHSAMRKAFSLPSRLSSEN